MTDIFNIDANGVITTDTSDILEEIQGVYKTAFGNELNISADTPQGQLITNDTTICTTAQDKLLQIANNFSVYTATGSALDVAGGVFGYFRKLNQPTIVNGVELQGVANTLIPAGSIANDGTNDFTLLENVILDKNGKGTGTFKNDEAVPCLANTLTTIITVIQGWDGVNNPQSGIVGYAEENDNVFRQRITANWLNIRAKGLLSSIIDTIAQLDGVVSVVGNENPSNITKTIDGIEMISHSIYLTILGGSNTEIARVLAQKKTLGCDTVGDVIITYTTPLKVQSQSYRIYRPTNTPLKVQISYSDNVNTPANIQDVLIQTLQGYITNNPFTIGETISGNLLANAFDDFKLCDILQIQLNLAAESGFLNYVKLSNLQVATLENSNISFNKIQYYGYI